MVSRETTVPWENSEVLRRVNRLRGLRLADTGKAVPWTELGRAIGWTATTSSDVSSGRRDLRLPEVAVIATYFGCSPGWLAFGEGIPFPVPAQTPGIPNAPVEDAFAAIERDLQARPAATQPVRRQARGKRAR